MNDKDVLYLKKYLPDYKYQDGIERLKRGEAVQYIVGNVDFYGYNFIVNKNVLIPRFETEQLIEKTIKLIKKEFNKKIDILDIGTGSGCIAITLNKELDSNVDGIDISNKALDVAKENNLINKSKVNFFQSDVFSNVTKKYDVIISNPPYIAKDDEVMEIVYNNEPHIALFADNRGLYFYEKIISESKNFLKDKFIMAFEIGYNEGVEVKKIANRYFKNAIVTVEKDYNDFDRFVFIIGR